MNIYILIDGLSEDVEQVTSLAKSNHPNLDDITAYGELGLYQPVVREFSSNPETAIIFPYFFGLAPDHNPGRAGLEIYTSGEDISGLRCFCIVRLIDKEYDISEVLSPDHIESTWSKAPPIKNLKPIQAAIEDVCKRIKDIKIVKSPRRNNTWAIGGKNRADIEDATNLMNYNLRDTCLYAYPMLNHLYSGKPVNILRKNAVTFLGWGYGHLVDALSYSGVRVRQSFSSIENHLFNYSNKLSDFKNNIMPILKNKCHSKDSFIIFFKEPSTASRENRTSEIKERAIYFIDEIVRLLYNQFKGNDVNIILLSDHQSNIGSKRTYQGSTLFFLGNLKMPVNLKVHFSEKNVTNRDVISQRELLLAIEKYIQA